jgi:hypothetical protein
MRVKEYFTVNEDPDYNEDGQLEQGPVVQRADPDVIWKQIVEEISKFNQTA